MEGVSFNEESVATRHSYGSSRSGGLAEKLVKWGIVKTSRQGEIVLLVTAVIAAILATVIFFTTKRSAPKPETPASAHWPK